VSGRRNRGCSAIAAIVTMAFVFVAPALFFGLGSFLNWLLP
jgi:hypothetical protein